MANPTLARKMALAAAGSLLAAVCLAAQASAAPPERAAVRVALAPVADGRTLAFPDSLPLHVENPEWALTAQPRGLPEKVRRRLVKELAKMEGVVVAEAPQLTAQPGPEMVRAAAELHRLDAVLAARLAVGFGQMQVVGYWQRAYLGRVQLALTVLSGRTGMALGPPLALEGSDETDVDFRRLDFDTIHHRGAGPEARERVDEAVRAVGRQLREKLSGAWIAAALAQEGLSARPAFGARLVVERVVLEPEVLRSGREGRMIVTYVVSGLAPGSVTTVTETRSLLRGGSVVAGPFRLTHSLGNGRHTSVQDLRVPADAEAGRYTLQGVVEAAGLRAAASGTFTVVAP